MDSTAGHAAKGRVEGRSALRAPQKITTYPVDLGTLIGNVIWIRETTRPRSSLTID
jgi:hypothetical protein